MKTNWKAKLQTVLTAEKTEMFAEKELTKTDKTPDNLVLSAFGSSELANISKNIGKKEAHLPKCSNCKLEMNLIENGNLWFCPLGCESHKAKTAPVSFADFYNAKLEKVLSDENLFADFETILDEQKAVLIINNKLDEDEAENVIRNPPNMRQIVMSV